MAFATSSKSALIGSMVFLSSGMDKALVSEALADHPANRHFNELHGAGLCRVVPEGELIDIAMQVLGAHVVIDTIMAALQKRPEAARQSRPR